MTDRSSKVSGVVDPLVSEALVQRGWIRDTRTRFHRKSGNGDLTALIFISISDDLPDFYRIDPHFAVRVDAAEDLVSQWFQSKTNTNQTMNERLTNLLGGGGRAFVFQWTPGPRELQRFRHLPRRRELRESVDDFIHLLTKNADSYFAELSSLDQVLAALDDKKRRDICLHCRQLVPIAVAIDRHDWDEVDRRLRAARAVHQAVLQYTTAVDAAEQMAAATRARVEGS